MTRRHRGPSRPASENEQLPSLVAEKLPLFVYVRELGTGNVTFANGRLRVFLGKSAARSSSLATSLNDLIHPDDGPLVELAQQRHAVTEEGEVLELAFRIRAPSGAWRTLRSREIVFARSRDGSPRLILGTAEDVTSFAGDEADREHRPNDEFQQQRLRRLLELHEKERRMVAYDVHDGFVQDVVGAQLGIDVMLDHLAETDPECLSQLLRVRASIRKAIDEARRVVSELRPATTDDGGLVEALQFLVHEAEVAHQLQVKFTYPKRFIRISPLLARALARIVQQALNNVHRHAKTREVTIQLARNGSIIWLEIADRGVGFKLESVPVGRFGLEGMRERARVFDGHTTIESKPGAGTRIVVEVPVDLPLEEVVEPPSRSARRPSVKKKRRRK